MKTRSERVSLHFHDVIRSDRATGEPPPRNGVRRRTRADREAGARGYNTLARGCGGIIPPPAKFFGATSFFFEHACSQLSRKRGVYCVKPRNKHHVLSIMRNRRDAGARRAEGESGTEMGRAGCMKTERERGAGGRRKRGLGGAG